MRETSTAPLVYMHTRSHLAISGVCGLQRFQLEQPRAQALAQILEHCQNKGY